MRPRKVFTISVLIASCFSMLRPAATEDDIRKKQSQLEKLRKEIDTYEGKIKDREKKEHASLDLLDTYDQQATVTRKLVRKLREDENSLQGDIDSTKQSLRDLGGQVSFLKKQYANYIQTVYKYGRSYDLELLLSSKSLNQLLIRSEYLRRFSDQRKIDLDRLTTKGEALENEGEHLHKQLLQQRQLIQEKKNEEDNLSRKTKKRKLILADIRKDKKNYQREINRKTNAVKDLEQLIVKLIEEDRIKKEREARLSKGKATNPATRESTAGSVFDAKRGLLRWPVTQGKVVAHFGNQQNPVLRTVTQNTGIDISVPAGTSVSAVADGEVSKIYWLPSFGNLLILNHNNGYLTVYAHLSEIAVNEQQTVREGDRIGTSGEALSGPLLHFEIYKGREKQDPEQWLRPRGLTQR